MYKPYSNEDNRATMPRLGQVQTQFRTVSHKMIYPVQEREAKTAGTSPYFPHKGVPPGELPLHSLRTAGITYWERKQSPSQFDHISMSPARRPITSNSFVNKMTLHFYAQDVRTILNIFHFCVCKKSTC